MMICIENEERNCIKITSTLWEIVSMYVLCCDGLIIEKKFQNSVVQLMSRVILTTRSKY